MVASGAAPDDDAASRQLLKHMDDVVLAGRDELLRGVSPRGAKALAHFLAASLKPGMSVTVLP